MNDEELSSGVTGAYSHPALERISKFSNEVFSRRMVGYSLNRAWVFLAFFTGNALLSDDGTRPVLADIYEISLIALVATLLAIGIAGTRLDRISRRKASQIAPAVLCALGTIAIPFAGESSVAGSAALVFAGTLTGIGSGSQLALWGKIYSAEGGPSAAAEVSIAYLLATLLVPFFHTAPLPVQMLFVCALPIGSSVILVLEMEGLSNEPREDSKVYEEKNGQPDNTDGAAESESVHMPPEYLTILVKLSISSLVFGCVVEVIRFFYSVSAPANTTFPELVFPVSATIVAVMMLGILFSSKRLDLAFSYKPVLIFMTLGCLLIPLFDSNHFLANVFALAGYYCFEIVSWVMLSDMCYRFNAPTFRTYGIGRAAVSGGVLMGAFLSSCMSSAVDITAQTRFAVSFLMAFAMVVTFTFTLTERDIARMHRSTLKRFNVTADGHRIVDDENNEELTLDDKIDIVAERYGISGRALEVLRLLAQGRTAARIEKELYISRGTVNTYTYRLYQKLDVHSKQELLDLVYDAK